MLVTKRKLSHICFAESSKKELLSVRERIQKTERESSSVALGICQFHDQLSHFKMSGKRVKRKSGSRDVCKV